MPETPDDNVITEAVRDLAARATLPFQAARAVSGYGTAFWYNDLIETADGRDVIRQYLVTAAPQTRFEIGQWTVREGLADPEQPLDELVMTGFARKWTALGDLGVAVMPTTELHLHAEKRDWRWDTQEITSGLAAEPDDIALLDDEPIPAYLLGHEVDDSTSASHPGRPQRLVEGEVVRVSADAPLTWEGEVPAGFDGAPAFTALPLPDGQLKFVCLGVFLPGRPGTVAGFDRLRPAIHALSPKRSRHWWLPKR